MKSNPVATYARPQILGYLSSTVIRKRWQNSFYVGLENCLKRAEKINLSNHTPVLGFGSQAEWI